MLETPGKYGENYHRSVLKVPDCGRGRLGSLDGEVIIVEHREEQRNMTTFTLYRIRNVSRSTLQLEEFTMHRHESVKNYLWYCNSN